MASSAETWPVLLLMVLILGGIYAGLVTPNEAGGLGVFGALLIAVLTGRITPAALWQSIARTLRLTAGIIVASAIGGLVEIAPLFTIDETVEPAPDMRV